MKHIKDQHRANRLAIALNAELQHNAEALAMSEDDLLGIIKPTVKRWVDEEMQANGDCVPRHQRETEHIEALCEAIRDLDIN